MSSMYVYSYRQESELFRENRGKYQENDVDKIEGINSPGFLLFLVRHSYKYYYLSLSQELK